MRSVRNYLPLLGRFPRDENITAICIRCVGFQPPAIGCPRSWSRCIISVLVLISRRRNPNGALYLLPGASDGHRLIPIGSSVFGFFGGPMCVTSARKRCRCPVTRHVCVQCEHRCTSCFAVAGQQRLALARARSCDKYVGLGRNAGMFYSHAHGGQ
jgi:hypothetical protein